MSIAPTQTDQAVVLYDIPWEKYEALLDLFGDRRFRHTYDRGTLEIMSPSRAHEHIKKLIARMVERMAEELDLDIQRVGSLTQRRKKSQRGLEPDECYYFANEPAVRRREEFDAGIDPPPDLAVEVDVTSSSVERMPIYASLKIPEVWRYDGERMNFYRLAGSGRYVKARKSATFPFLTPADLERFLAMQFDVGERKLLQAFVAWLRERVNE